MKSNKFLVPSEAITQKNIVYVMRIDPKYRHLLDLWTWDSTGDLNPTSAVISLLRSMFRMSISPKTANTVAKIIGKRIGEKAKQQGRMTSQPDFVLTGLFRNKITGAYCAGIQIELKTEDFKLFKKNGDLYANEHVRKQYEVLQIRKKSGIVAEFAAGHDPFFNILDNFLSENELVAE